MLIVTSPGGTADTHRCTVFWKKEYNDLSVSSPKPAEVLLGSRLRDTYRLNKNLLYLIEIIIILAKSVHRASCSAGRAH